MRVLLTMDGTELGVCGSEVYAVELARALDHLGISVHIFVDGRLTGEFAHLRSAGSRIVVSQSGSADSAKASPDEADFPHFWERQALEQFDVINVHGTGNQALSAASTGRPTIVTVHGYNRSRLNSSLIQSRTRLVAVGYEQSERMRAEGHSIADVIHPGVDLSRFRPGPVDDAVIDLRACLKTVLFVGEFITRKNPKALVRAAYRLRLRRDSNDTRFIFVGDGPLRSSTEALVRQLGIADSVKFISHADHDTLIAYYRRADLTVIPSFDETYSMVAIEALACGSELTVSQSVSEIRRKFPGVPAFDPHSEEELTTVIERCLNREPSPVERMRLAEYDWHHIAQRYIALFEDTK